MIFKIWKLHFNNYSCLHISARASSFQIFLHTSMSKWGKQVSLCTSHYHYYNFRFMSITNWGSGLKHAISVLKFCYRMSIENLHDTCILILIPRSKLYTHETCIFYRWHPEYLGHHSKQIMEIHWLVFFLPKIIQIKIYSHLHVVETPDF